MATRSRNKQKMVLLVTTEILRPYKAGEIIGVPEDIARKLLNVNMQDEFGQAYYPKVRLYNEEADEHLQLVNHTLNDEEAQKLLRRLHPEQYDDDEEDDVFPEDDYEDDGPLSLPDSADITNEFDVVSQASQAKRGRGRPRGSANRKR